MSYLFTKVDLKVIQSFDYSNKMNYPIYSLKKYRLDNMNNYSNTVFLFEYFELFIQQVEILFVSHSMVYFLDE